MKRVGILLMLSIVVLAGCGVKGDPLTPPAKVAAKV